ncbi:MULTISPECIES: YhjD/YihY/BrkB family envelope integrity protein [unclassified Streptomyces]|uniref:YhjD/YihY/BrkB family envelope integrity protein n=1 Tax=unclassified Streptomyces TaxID=2593676 RepID=UPI00224DA74D|nr:MULTISPECIES: YhjD/YihY/BrkB family envelope integrity protein [unclassified Streptomyces]MCX4529605.1 YihY/virulence factor BrkB family protein [Streptomyces sp. NBC_01551]MCX4539822.1 YihY/virulence factor BrkB family protein [Streptomyces sp. NBC_01565]
MPSKRKARWQARSRELVATGNRLRGRAETRFPVITHVAERMVVVNIFDSATRLAAQCFLTAVPLFFVVASFAPEGVQEQLVESVRTMFGLTGQASDQLSDIFGGSDDDTRNAVGAAGAVIVLLSATAVSRAMQRLCRRAWEIPRAGARIVIWRWFAWIAVWMVLLILQGPVRDGFGLGLWLGIPLTLLFQTLVWWWSQHLLLGGVIPWPPLLPGALLTSAAITALSLGARVYMPIALNRSIAAYGSTGSVFVILSWLIVLCVAVAIGISTGAAVAQEPYLARRLGSPAPGRLRDDPL